MKTIWGGLEKLITFSASQIYVYISILKSSSYWWALQVFFYCFLSLMINVNSYHQIQMIVSLIIERQKKIPPCITDTFMLPNHYVP